MNSFFDLSRGAQGLQTGVVFKHTCAELNKKRKLVKGIGEAVDNT